MPTFPSGYLWIVGSQQTFLLSRTDTLPGRAAIGPPPISTPGTFGEVRLCCVLPRGRTNL